MSESNQGNNEGQESRSKTDSRSRKFVWRGLLFVMSLIAYLATLIPRQRVDVPPPEARFFVQSCNAEEVQQEIWRVSGAVKNASNVDQKFIRVEVVQIGGKGALLRSTPFVLADGLFKGQATAEFDLKVLLKSGAVALRVEIVDSQHRKLFAHADCTMAPSERDLRQGG